MTIQAMIELAKEHYSQFYQANEEAATEVLAVYAMEELKMEKTAAVEWAAKAVVGDLNDFHAPPEDEIFTWYFINYYLGEKRISERMVFPNGFTSWMETNFEVVTYITEINNKTEGFGACPLLEDAQASSGHYAIVEMAKDLTDKFEKLHEGREWDGEYFETLQDFLYEELPTTVNVMK
jgi:hypothetical protein